MTDDTTSVPPIPNAAIPPIPDAKTTPPASMQGGGVDIAFDASKTAPAVPRNAGPAAKSLAGRPTYTPRPPKEPKPSAAPVPASPVEPSWFETTTSATPFPYAGLPGLLRDTIDEVSENNDIDPAIVSMSCIAAIGFAQQSIYDVRHPMSGAVMPTSLLLMCTASSGDRKSTADSFCHRGIASYTADNADLHRSERAAHYAQTKAYAASLRKKEQKPEDAVDPPPPLLGSFSQRISDATPEGIQSFFSEVRCDAAQMTSEGISVVSGAAFKAESLGSTLAQWTHLYDGSSVGRTRVGVGHIELFGRRLFQWIQMQPSVSSALLGNKVVSGQGWLARVLMAYPESRIGEREFKLAATTPTPALEEFTKVTREIAERIERVPPELAKGHVNLHVIEVSADPAVLRLLKEFHDYCEKGSAKGGRFFEILSHAQRGVENAVRLAAQFAAFRNVGTGDDIVYRERSIVTGWRIEHCDLLPAVAIVAHSLKSKLRLLESSSKTELDDDAVVLLRWIVAQPAGAKITLNYIGKMAPSRFRSTERRRDVIKLLTDSGDLFKLPGTNEFIVMKQ